ncbi:glycoside hydrolase family 88 protein [Hungatella hathewayi]|uniref:glycoside hydrolase family 88 protein n=1 Tax=Hungatella hathewayi TaxID=154046 RepID=UPI00210ACBE9|nr:glycoside hydrolase family 88 protein [Hungatella hathewayi]MCQ5385120.1 glycoside hydrolase family 88 protein [Hungatella hathewayi]
MNRGTSITYEIDGHYNHLYLDIVSSRNQSISRYSDLSPHHASMAEQAEFQKELVSNDSTEKPVGERDIWYPVVDIDMDDSMYGVLELEGWGNYQMNQSQEHALSGSESVVVSFSELEHWENNFVADDTIMVKKFRIRKDYSHVDKGLELKIGFLSSDWSGRIVLWSDDTGEKRVVFEEDLQMKNHPWARESESGKKERYLKGLKGSVDYILRNQVKKKDSRYFQGLNLFYDHDAKIYRQPSWVWTWGPAVSTLLEAAEIPGIAEEYSREFLHQKACEIGEASLRFQFTEDPSSPAYGLVFCRRDYDLRIKNCCMDFLSPPDSLFLAGWGWMALYHKTGEKKYLEATRLLVEQTARLLKTNEDIIEQDYMMPANEWKDWILDEAGFGMKGIAELYRALPEEAYREWGKTYITQILNCLEREDGLWNRMWTRSTRSVSEISCHTRAMGWAMEGLLSSYQLLNEKQYLEKAEKMADAMLKVQNDDGSWYFVFAEGSENQGIAEKGTAYWSGLLYRLYEYSGENKYFNAAEKALEWCLDNQYWGDDFDGYGGIIGRNPSSGVIYRRFFDLSCTYTSAFVGDAIVRAWKYL